MALRPTLPCSRKEILSDNGDGSDKPGWSDLPPDLISLISQKLTDISDFVRFRFVCKRWRSAVRASDLAPQLPWIIYDYENLERGYLRFYSLLSSETYTVAVPQFTDKSVRGSAYNYLLIHNQKNRECSLFNPLTKEELSLPRAEILFPSCVPSGLSPDQSSRYAIMSKSPSACSTPLFHCRPGDHKWTRIDVRLFRSRAWSEFDEFLNSGFTFYDGRCYASDRETGYTNVIDLATGTVTHVVPLPEPDLRGIFVYLVPSFGEILRVCQYKKYSSKKPCYFRIYRLELGNSDGNAMDPCWVEIDNISNQFLFLYDVHGCAFRADNFPGFVANGIYFSKENLCTFELFRYDLKERKIEVLPVPVNLGQNWFVPSL